MVYLRGTMASLEDAINSDIYDFLNQWVKTLLGRIHHEPVDEMAFERTLRCVDAVGTQLEGIPRMPRRAGVVTLREIQNYRSQLAVVVGWVRDIRASQLWGALEARFEAEHLEFQRFWHEAQRAEMEVDD